MHQTYLFIINCIETKHHVYRSKSTAENPPYHKAVIPTLLTHLCLSAKIQMKVQISACMMRLPVELRIFVNLPENRSGMMRVDFFVNFSTCRTSCNIGTSAPSLHSSQHLSMDIEELIVFFGTRGSLSLYPKLTTRT